MKTLDVHALHEGIQHTIEKLDKQKQQLEKLEKSVEHLAGMKDALKGKGGDAIRTFYEECHKPFLLFFGMFIDEYKKVLKQTQHAISSVESDSHGMIAEAFLSHDARHGVKHAREVTEQLTDAVNRQTSAIDHIVSLPTVNDSFFRMETEQAERLITDTLHKLFQFDGQQTQALETAKSDFQTMKKYIDQLETMYTGPKIEITGYKSGSILKSQEEENINQTFGAINPQMKQSDDSPMEMMIEKLKDKISNKASHIKKDKGNTNNIQTTIFTAKRDIGDYNETINSPEIEGIAGNRDENILDLYKKFMDYRVKIKEERNGILGFYGTGNVSGLFEISDEQLVNTKIDMSLFDTNKAIKDKNKKEKVKKIKKSETYFTALGGSAEFSIPRFSNVFNTLLSGDMIGGSAELNGINAVINHEKSPLALEFKLLHAGVEANVSNTGGGLGGSASVSEVGVTASPLNWFGYEPLEEWFGIENKNPYIGVGFSIGSLGLGASANEGFEVYIADGVGISFKAGIEDEDKEDE